ncbi:MAG: RHS repeat-associated core domain-containing protein [Phycisphaerae bacterium]|nr:RHS repeat-associated core domain-containing protein [Phycisphaerae bacterium]
MTYTIGDDVLTQANDDDTEIRHLMYDGHGSTRLLTDDNGDIKATYAYDAYGNAEGFGASTAATKYLYAGEQYDSNLAMYYLLARYYMPTVGIFNRPDPFQGDPFAPQSLHKYAYVWNDPVNNIDPTGLFGFTFTQIAVTSGIIGLLAGITTYAITGSVKAAIIVGVLAALITAAVMICITYWPQIMNWMRGMLRYQQAHRTVSNRVYQRMVARCGDDIALRVRFFSGLKTWKLWLIEFPIGVTQNLTRLFTNPMAFVQWLNPTPAAWIALGIGGAAGAVALILYFYRDDPEALEKDLKP